MATLVLGYHAGKMTPDASFLKMIPTGHPYVQNFLDNKEDLSALGNVVRIAVENTEGSILDAGYMDTLQKVNDEVFFIPGVDRATLRVASGPCSRPNAALHRGGTEDGFDRRGQRGARRPMTSPRPRDWRRSGSRKS